MKILLLLSQLSHKHNRGALKRRAPDNSSWPNAANNFWFIIDNFVWFSQKTFLSQTYVVSKVPKWDNLVVRSADFYFSNVINSKCTLALYLYWNGKKGKQVNKERDRERESVSVSVGALRKNKLSVRHKTNRWEKPSWPVFGISHEGLVISGKLF